jgi:SHS2 domain-containing protein
MTSVFKFLDHTADIALEVSGSTLDELFLAALNGWKSAVIEPTDNKREESEIVIKLKESSIEELLITFLQEINYLFESKKVFPSDVNTIMLQSIGDEFSLVCKAVFVRVLREDFIKTEIKAVTFHQLEIRKSRDVYKTKIVFDI